MAGTDSRFPQDLRRLRGCRSVRILSRSLRQPNEDRQSLASQDVPVFLEKAAIAAAVFARAGDDWVGHVVTGAIDPNPPDIGISVPETEIYAGLDLTSAAAG